MRRNKKMSMLSYLERYTQSLLIVVVGVVLALTLAVIQKDYEPLYYSLYAFVSEGGVSTDKMAMFIDSVLVYGMQLCGIWVAMQFSKGKYLGMAILGVTTVTYSFTSVSIMLLYGFKGIFVVLLTCGIQMVSVVMLMIHILQQDMHSKRPSKMALLACAGGLTVALATFNVYVQPMLEKVVQLIIKTV